MGRRETAPASFIEHYQRTKKKVLIFLPFPLKKMHCTFLALQHEDEFAKGKMFDMYTASKKTHPNAFHAGCFSWREWGFLPIWGSSSEF